MSLIVQHTAGTTGRGCSASIFKHLPTENDGPNPAAAADVFDDFYTYDETDIWTETAATAGTSELDVLGQNGILKLDAASGTADQGIQTQAAEMTFTHQPVKGHWLLYEARVAISDTPSNQFFAGLGTVDTSFFASGANSTTDHIGFEMNALTVASDAGKALFVAEKGGTRESTTNVHTFTDIGTSDLGSTDSDPDPTSIAWVRLGFVVGYVNGASQVEGFVNGTRVGAALTTAAVPVVVLRPTFLMQSEGSSDPVLYVDWVRIAQVQPF